MKYLCLACGDEAAWEQLSEDEQQSMVEADDIDKATELASLHPAARMGEELGWYVVVSPIFTPELQALEAGEGRAAEKLASGPGSA